MTLMSKAQFAGTRTGSRHECHGGSPRRLANLVRRVCGVAPTVCRGYYSCKSPSEPVFIFQEGELTITIEGCILPTIL